MGKENMVRKLIGRESALFLFSNQQFVRSENFFPSPYTYFIANGSISRENFRRYENRRVSILTIFFPVGDVHGPVVTKVIFVLENERLEGVIESTHYRRTIIPDFFNLEFFVWKIKCDFRVSEHTHFGIAVAGIHFGYNWHIFKGIAGVRDALLPYFKLEAGVHLDESVQNTSAYRKLPLDPCRIRQLCLQRCGSCRLQQTQL